MFLPTAIEFDHPRYVYARQLFDNLGWVFTPEILMQDECFVRWVNFHEKQQAFKKELRGMKESRERSKMEEANFDELLEEFGFREEGCPYR